MSVVDDIKQRIDIVEFIGEFVTLQKSGHNFKSVCPFHSEKTPSFFVFPDRQTWHCFGACGTGGDIFTFVMKKEGVDFPQALRQLADRAGITLSTPDSRSDEKDRQKERLYDLNGAAASYYNNLLKDSQAARKARDYLVQRGVSEEIIEEFQLGYCRDSFDDLRNHLLGKGFSEQELVAAGVVKPRDDGSGSYDRFRNRLIFPIRNDKGRVLGFGARTLDDSQPKYLNSPQTQLFDKGSIIYGIDRAKTAIRKEDYAIVVEGYMDVLASHQYGWRNTVASMGTALTQKQISSLKKLTTHIILALDADIAGEEATKRFAESIDAENALGSELKVVVPATGKDPDEEIRNNSESWTLAIQNARPLVDFVVFSVLNKVNLESATDKSVAVKTLLPLIADINDSIRRSHYLNMIAVKLKINERDIYDELVQYTSRKRKRRSMDLPDKSAQPSNLLFVTSALEEYCLGLLLRYHVLKLEGEKIPEDYFEYNENVALFKKWKQCETIEELKNSIDTALHPYIESLLNRSYPEPLDESEEKQRKDLEGCIIRLREKYLRNMELKKKELLSNESEIDGGLAELEKKGCQESRELKKVLDTRGHRRQAV